MIHRQFGWAIRPTMRWRSPKATSTTTGASSRSRRTCSLTVREPTSTRPGDRCCRRTPDAYYTGRPGHTPIRSRCGTRQARSATAWPASGVRGRRHRLELVGSVRRSGLRRRPRPVHGQRHGRRGVRVPTRRGAAVDRLASAKAGKPAPNAVAERVEVLEVSSSAFARSGRPPAMSGSKPRGPRGPRHTL